jgi:hypothetical protein
MTKKNLPELLTGGHLRWKIENEGFNVQKNQGFNLEHAYSKHPTGWEVFYLQLQIESTLEQLLRKSNLLSQELITSAKSSKNLALEALRNSNNERKHWSLLSLLLSSLALTCITSPKSRFLSPNLNP